MYGQSIICCAPILNNSKFLVSFQVFLVIPLPFPLLKLRLTFFTGWRVLRCPPIRFRRTGCLIKFMNVQIIQSTLESLNDIDIRHKNYYYALPQPSCFYLLYMSPYMTYLLISFSKRDALWYCGLQNFTRPQIQTGGGLGMGGVVQRRRVLTCDHTLPSCIKKKPDRRLAECIQVK